MDARDEFFTPPEIAADVAVLMAGAARGSRIADFAAGDGALLRALEDLVPQVQVFAADISGDNVRSLARQHPEWVVSRIDFLSERSRSRATVTRLAGGYDAVVLNPPFSYRGGHRETAVLGRERVSGSPAAVFVAQATEYVAPRGAIAAILPQSCMRCEKDAALWRTVKREWDITEVRAFGPRTFRGRAAKTVLTLLERHGRGTAEAEAAVRAAPSVEVVIVRGTLQMHRMGQGAEPLIHTTGLGRDGIRTRLVARAGARVTRGPAVLLPRVGVPALWKVQLYRSPEPLVLSDCVVALECAEVRHAETVLRRVQQHWPTFATAWTGSCAPYVTMTQLAEALERLGVASRLQAPELPRPRDPRVDAGTTSVGVRVTAGAG